jgi:hypothetical protein
MATATYADNFLAVFHSKPATVNPPAEPSEAEQRAEALSAAEEEPVRHQVKRAERKSATSALNFQTEELVMRRAPTDCANIHPAIQRTAPYSITILAQTGSGQ